MRIIARNNATRLALCDSGPPSATFATALAFLAHPFSLAALALMALNDGLLRWLAPSWWTGKLSDVSWLFFVPFVVAAYLSWLLPLPFSTRSQPGGISDALRQKAHTRHRRGTFALAYLVTGLSFALVKSLPAVNALAGQFFARISGASPALRLDPSDLLGLVGLALSAAWWLAWERRTCGTATQRAKPGPGRKASRLAALPLAMLLLMADAAAPDMGITCFTQLGGKILAKAGYQTYASSDGGLIWQPDTPGSALSCTPAAPGQATVMQSVPGGISYQYQAGADIQSSRNGVTWQTAYHIPVATQPEQIYLLRTHSGNPIYTPGPSDATIDSASGNALFAMGLRGVLVHTQAGDWRWAVGMPYQPTGSFPSADAFAVLLGGTLLLAAGLALLVFSALALRWTLRWPRGVIWALAVLAWLGVDLLFPPATSSGYNLTVTFFGMLALALLILPLAVEQTFRLIRRAPSALPRLIGLAIAAGLVYFIPYLLWLYNQLPNFDTVTLVGGVVAALVLLLGFFTTRRIPRHLPGATALLLLALVALTLSACSSTQALRPRGLQRWVAAPTRTPFLPAASPQPAQDPTKTAAPLPLQPPPSTTHPAAAPTQPPPTPSGPQIQANYRSGQTFITWVERADLQGERYRVYRAAQPITAQNLSQATLLAETSKNSSRFYGSMFVDGDVWHYRYTERLITQDNAAPTPAGVGLLVWTPDGADLSGGKAGYYAVTLTPAGGKETFSPAYATGAVEEAVADPLPVEITHSPGVETTAQSHIYVQYMDLRHWNPTYHAPNATNRYYGFNPADPDLPAALAYAYDYQVFTPTPEDCGGAVPKDLPVMLFLHGARTNRYGTISKNPYTHCAYTVFPIDQSDTWYFGFARAHDYRKGGQVGAGDVIENYTERRVLRMLYDLMRVPPGPPVDTQRVYVFGHSMGGSGTLGFAERYPNVFAAGYSGQPISDYRTSGVTKNDWVANVAVKWGAPALNLPIHSDAPAGWAAPLQKYNGVGVWDWQNYLGNLTGETIPGRLADEMVPFGIDHGINDDVILWPTQGQAFYPRVALAPRVWSGAVTPAKHEWSDFAALLPSLAKLGKEPFWNLQVRREETVPAISHLSSNLPDPPGAPTSYNQTVKWSSSWDPWDKAPLDTADHYQISLCAVQPGSYDCGSGGPVSASITPRRTQKFKVQPGAQYDWENRQVRDNAEVARGTVTASADGLLTVPDFRITPQGNRLIIKPHAR